MKKVRIFVDHANFENSWRGAVGRKGPNIAWSIFPDIVMRELRSHGFLRSDEAELRGINVYASTHPSPNDHERDRERWLRYGLDQLPGYTVKTALRQRQPCDHGIHTEHFVEKGVDTMIVCDMLSFAMRDFYDVGVIVSDDSDLIPSIDSVQSVLDRQMVHIGFKGSGQGIRSAAWGHLLLDPVQHELAEERKSKRPTTPATSVIASEAALEHACKRAIPLEE